MKNIHVFDMDGVLVDSTHRYRIKPDGRIDLDHWIANEHKAFDDQPGPLWAQYRQDCRKDDTYVVIATARVINDPDRQFIDQKLGNPDYLISRNGRNDTRGGAELKIKGLRKLLSLRQFQKATMTIYEDNMAYLKAICDTFNCHGVYIPSKQGH